MSSEVVPDKVSGGHAIGLPPLFRWAGSKKQLLGTLAPYWSTEFARYIEPFAGSACLFFRIRPKAALLGDINAELIASYRVIGDAPEEVWEQLRGLRADASYYYELRAMVPSTLAPAARAARFIYLNRFCFNGLYRTNAKGQFNVPYGGPRSGSLPSLEDLRTYAAAIQGVSFLASDFVSTLAEAQRGDFVYLDPPYAVAAEWRRGLHYTEDAFAVDDVSRLESALSTLDDLGAIFVVSYADSPEGHRLAKPFYCRSVEVRRSIAGSVFKRVRRTELLISNRPHRGWVAQT
jgi:DNA adenine methylase